MSDKNSGTTQSKEKKATDASKNPAMMVKTQKLPTKLEYAQDQRKKEKSDSQN